MERAWLAVGLIGQALFFSRFFVQWLASERAGRSVAPRSFWWLSLGGTLLLGAYTLHRDQAILLPIFAINLGVYARNLALPSGRCGRLHPVAAAGLGLCAGLLLLSLAPPAARPATALEPGWRFVGAIGSALWSVRFLIQWYASERRGSSHFPPNFWIVSLVGNLALLAYALRLGDPVYIAGFLPGPLVQARNLMLSFSATSPPRRNGTQEQ